MILDRMRQLSQIEQALTITNQTFPLAAVCVLVLDKGPSGQALQTAISIVQKGYPLLQSCIVEKNGHFHFEKVADKTSVKLNVLQRRDDMQWLELARVEVNQGFDHTSSPLMRAHYLKSSESDQAELILSFHHAVIDSVFLLSFIDQLLSQAGGEARKPEKHQLTVPEAPMPSPLLSDVLPSSYKKTKLIFRLIPFVFRQLRVDLAYKQSTRLSKDTPISASSENDISILSFTEEETLTLIRHSRANQISLNSLLLACMLLVVNSHNYGDRKRRVRAIQFANLRPYLTPPVADSVDGCFIAMSRLDVSLTQSKDLIQVAKSIDLQSAKAAKRGDKFVLSLLSKMLIKKSFRDRKERLGTAALSYAGPIKLKQQYGSIRISGLHSFITNNCLGPELSGFGKICFKRLSLDLNFLSAEVSKEKVIQMTTDLKSMLLQLNSVR